MYLQQLARVDKVVKALEIEAVRFDLNEAHTDPDGPGYQGRSRSVSLTR